MLRQNPIVQTLFGEFARIQRFVDSRLILSATSNDFELMFTPIWQPFGSHWGAMFAPFCSDFSTRFGTVPH